MFKCICFETGRHFVWEVKSCTHIGMQSLLNDTHCELHRLLLLAKITKRIGSCLSSHGKSLIMLHSLAGSSAPFQSDEVFIPLWSYGVPKGMIYFVVGCFIHTVNHFCLNNGKCFYRQEISGCVYLVMEVSPDATLHLSHANCKVKIEQRSNFTHACRKIFTLSSINSIALFL